MAARDTCRCAEFVDIVVASPGTVETGLDAVTLILDLRKGEIDFGDNTSYIKATHI